LEQNKVTNAGTGIHVRASIKKKRTQAHGHHVLGDIGGGGGGGGGRETGENRSAARTGGRAGGQAGAI